MDLEDNSCVMPLKLLKNGKDAIIAVSSVASFMTGASSSSQIFTLGPSFFIQMH